MFHAPSPVFACKCSCFRAKRAGDKFDSITDWCGHGSGLPMCVCRNLQLDLLRSSQSLEMGLFVAAVVSRMNWCKYLWSLIWSPSFIWILIESHMMRLCERCWNSFIKQCIYSPGGFSPELPVAYSLLHSFLSQLEISAVQFLFVHLCAMWSWGTASPVLRDGLSSACFRKSFSVSEAIIASYLFASFHNRGWLFSVFWCSVMKQPYFGPIFFRVAPLVNLSLWFLVWLKLS